MNIGIFFCEISYALSLLGNYVQSITGVYSKAFLFFPSATAWVDVSNAICTVESIPRGVGIGAFVLCFLTVFGNLLVLIAIVKDPYKELKTIPYYLIMNLAVCDLIVGIPREFLLGLLYFLQPHQWLWLWNLHFVAYRSLYFSMVASSLTILTLAFERYIMVEAPFRSKDFLIYSHLKLSIGYIWLISACAAGLSLLNICNEREYRHEYRFILTNAFGFPTVIFMFLIYSRIFYVVRKFIRQDLNNPSVSPRDGLLASDNSLTESIRRREREIAMSVFLFVGAFALCWVPYFVMENVIYLAKEETRMRLGKTADWVRYSGMVSSLLNPIIYALRYEKFRKAVRGIFRRRTNRFTMLSEDFVRPAV